ncbi:MAG TPA: hypothetical protein DIU39_00270 [Flavobacteriales bacterium]|nr:hypothetical protein [Flavobacteriales bacterium]|tara:strand:- start:2193 stop:2381 length:189 start_codon:yes stop_codon:yes gene_type:complete
MNRKKIAWIIIAILFIGPFQLAFADIGEYSNAISVISMAVTVIGSVIALVLANTGDDTQQAH